MAAIGPMRRHQRLKAANPIGIGNTMRFDGGAHCFLLIFLNLTDRIPSQQ
jgi:hypothetical protein